MKITDNIDARCVVKDIETMKELTYVGCFNGETGEKLGFEISKRKNQLFEFVQWYKGNTFDYTVTYNGVAFDCPVLQFIVDNHQEWADFNTQEIIDEIYRFSQHTIQESNNGRPTYRESSFTKPTIDVFTILGLNNANLFTSLKGCEFALQMPNLQTMPIHHSKKDLTDEEIQMTIDYCSVDLEGTWNVFLLVLGKYPHPLYEGNNQVQLRFDIREEFKIECLNYSDIKIGDEILKKGCIEEMKIDPKQFPRSGTFRKQIKLKDCVPDYVKFKTPELQKVLEKVKKTVINPNQEKQFELKFQFDGTKYTLGLGGGHSEQESEIWKTDELFYLSDLDTASQYPATAIEFDYFPQHIKAVFGKVYKPIYFKRIDLKPQSKKDKRIKGICDGLKLTLNAPTGKFRDKTSWMYDAKPAISICLTSQMLLLYLIELMYFEGIHCFSFNTDGATFTVPFAKKDKYQEKIKEWETLTNFTLEEQKFKELYYASVNDYIGIKDDGGLKTKGEFVSDMFIHKNSSMRVVPLALQEYFKTGTHPKDFIEKHSNIYDFCIRAKATGDFYLEEVVDENKSIKHDKMLRYYISKEGNLLFKRGFNSKGKEFNGWVNAPIAEIGTPLKITNFNKYVEKDNYNIDYSFYIIKSLRILDKLLKKKMLDSYLNSIKQTTQISMF